MTSYDTIIVGAGPTGLATGIELKRRGVSCLLIEKGCVCNSIYHYPVNMTWFTTPELLEIGDIPMTSNGDKPNRIESLKYYRKVADHYGLTIHQYERVHAVDGSDGAFTVRTEDKNGCFHRYAASKVVLSTGFYDVPNYLRVPGEDLPKVVHYYKEAHPFFDQDVIVVGAKNSAAIAALELLWAGARVTMVIRGEAIHHHVKYWIKPNIENRIKAGEIKAYFRTQIIAIEPDQVQLDTPEGPVTLKNDFVFAMTGYRPDLEFLAGQGVTLQSDTRKPYSDPDTLESARPGVYLAGVIVAGMFTNEIFIENGRFHGAKIAEAIKASLAAQPTTS